MYETTQFIQRLAHVSFGNWVWFTVTSSLHFTLASAVTPSRFHRESTPRQCTQRDRLPHQPRQAQLRPPSNPQRLVEQTVHATIREVPPSTGGAAAAAELRSEVQVVDEVPGGDGAEPGCGHRWELWWAPRTTEGLWGEWPNGKSFSLTY